ncbi:hypothetical protein IFO69_00230 [Echinicola sp. CAU 1574]|uniref:Glycosyltransferase RgtA/B/C/D-like domain-containing protein n=1 Tax=Echinicola arenosa TaxID=2774144 RepID=A0ABR9AGU4_9BACT|nr:hypothetical protein [Echinicola arenosa]MBD8487160.1 hypothetical protein [Echinicola arenosa]
MPNQLNQNQQYLTLGAGGFFLVVYWIFGYDGITFSDDVSYLELGQRFWMGEEVLTNDHFTSRWGAYIFSGLITFLFGYNDHLASLSSLIYYLGAMLMIWKTLPNPTSRGFFVLFFASNVYLLHFLTKVYPDAALVFWTALILFAAFYRHQKPLWSALLMSAAFFVGFCTKETIVFLAPLPLMLWWLDFRNKAQRLFYVYFFSSLVILAIGYLTYFSLKFEDPLFRFKSIQDGHYISPYTYFDKDWKVMLQRITYSPVFTFVERAYWLWFILAVPGIFRAFKNKRDLSLIFAFSSICLILGFWFMSTSFSYYNPIYLNPRHLIILLVPFSVNIALESKRWMDNFFWNRFCSLWIAFGGFIALGALDWKLGTYYILFAGALLLCPKPIKTVSLVILLILPTFISVGYQKHLKNYPHLKEEFTKAMEKSRSSFPLVTHDFLLKSRGVITGNYNKAPHALALDGLKEKVRLDQQPEEFQVFIYKYYKHAYPEEVGFVNEVNRITENNHYVPVNIFEDKWIKITHFKRVSPLSPFSNSEYSINIEPYSELFSWSSIDTGQ